MEGAYELPGSIQPLIFPVLFIMSWVVIWFILARLSGWHSLANHYTPTSPFTGRRFWLQSAQFRGWFGYNGCLTAGANPFGLHLSVWLIFRVGHPPLFIPWREVTVVLGKRFWVPVAYLVFAKAPTIQVVISRHLAEKLAAESSSQFALPSEAR